MATLIRRSLCTTTIAAALMLTGCNSFYDEGARFANQVANFAAGFRNTADDEAVFEYVPKYGNDQTIRVGIGRIRWCPHPPCTGQGAATVHVERGKSGTGYRIAAEASVPKPLSIEKSRGPVRVHLRKENGEVEVVGLE